MCLRLEIPAVKARPAQRLSLVLAMLLAMVSTAVATAEPVDSQFNQTWERTDRPVSTGQVSRTWMWGPQALTGVLTEEYAESPGGEREVQYFDKSRMEITNPDAVDDGVWYVTNGLLSTELITGRVQLGHDTFDERQPAQVNVAGDPDDPTGPTYASFTGLLDAPPAALLSAIVQRVSRDGTVTNDSSLGGLGITATHIDDVTNHAIAEPFWLFMNSTGTVWEDGSYQTAGLFLNPYFATGRPITEPYWAEVIVGGTARDVLIQCFERRCLTYTPDNPEGWQVEAGNVGQHYHQWRYGQQEPTIPQIIFISNIAGAETSAGSVEDGVRYGTTFIGPATGDVAGTFVASINYSPPNPGPNVVNTVVGGTWSITSGAGSVSGVFSSGTAVWDDKEEVATISVIMKVLGGSGIYDNAPREATFHGTLDHRGWPPNPPRIEGVLVMYR
jgi:hypothetical protein